jgi:hypothetical protein
MEMMMTCRGGFSDSSEQAERMEARARIVKAVVIVLDADLRRARGFESPRRRRTGERFIRGCLLTGERSYY